MMGGLVSVFETKTKLEFFSLVNSVFFFYFLNYYYFFNFFKVFFSHFSVIMYGKKKEVMEVFLNLFAA